MKIGQKSQILIVMLIVVGIIITVGFFFLLSLTSTTGNETIVKENGTENEGKDVNKIPVQNTIGTSSSFVFISPEDTIQSVDFSNSNRTDLVLFKYSWKDLKISENSQYFSALGKETADSAYNLFVYDFSRKQLEKKTTFTVTSGGITSYTWQSNVIFFTQGKGVENWVHRFNPASDEIFKVKQIQGLIYNKSKDNKFLFFRDHNSKPLLLDNSAGLVWDLSELKDVEENKVVVENVIFTDVFDKIVIRTKENLFFKAKFRENLVAKIEIDQAVYPMYNFACSPAADVLVGIVEKTVNETSSTFFVNADILLQQVKEIKKIEELVEFTKIKDVICYKDNLLINYLKSYFSTSL